MADKKPHQPSEAMIDETLAESFPASDPPNWDLGIDNTQPSVEPPKGRVYTTREAVLALLSDAEVARVANLESAALLATARNTSISRVQNAACCGRGPGSRWTWVTSCRAARCASRPGPAWSKRCTGTGRAQTASSDVAERK